MIHLQDTNRHLLLIALCSLGLVLLSSCDSNSSGTEEPEPEVEVNTVEDLDATGENGNFTFFSLRTGQEIAPSDSATTNWDIAFRETSVLINSGVSGPGEAGAILLDVPFDQVEIAPAQGYAIDSEEVLAIPTGNNNGWYTYTGMNEPQHAILPLPDKTIVVKTADGNHYAKIEMISYYKGNPDTSTEEFADYMNRVGNQFYTFRYAIQQTEGLRELN